MSSVPSRAQLPARLVDIDQWVCWRTEERDGKQTKVPINPHTGVYASTADASTWGSFETARAYAEDGPPDGIGFVFTAETPFVGVDLDECRTPETGTLTEEAAAIVETLDSYTEVSPSGTGVHVIAEGTLPEGRNRRDWVECYEQARFFTVTGDHVAGTPETIAERFGALAQVHGEYLQGQATTPDTDTDTAGEAAADTAPDPETTGDAAAAGGADSGGGANDLSDAALLDRARGAANGEKFNRLWQGNTAGYESHSEADMALCSLLAFWTGGDAQRLDRLFRQSGLMRPKWDETHYADGSTYGEKTIERVLGSADEFYDPGPSPRDGASAETASESRAASTSAASGTKPAAASDADAAPGTEADAGTETDAEAMGSDRGDGPAPTGNDDPGAVTPTGDTSAEPNAANDGSRPVESADGATPVTPPSDTSAEASAGTSEPTGSPRVTEPGDQATTKPSGAAGKRTEAELLALIEELQTHVERLEAENQRLRSELAAADEESTTETQPTRSRLDRFWAWLAG